MASDLAIPQLPELPCLGSYAWTLQVISTQAGEYQWAQEISAVDVGPAATRLDQQSHIELPEKTSGLCESWWWKLRTSAAKMNYLSDFGICNNSQCFLTMKITSCCWGTLIWATLYVHFSELATSFIYIGYVFSSQPPTLSGTGNE